MYFIMHNATVDYYQASFLLGIYTSKGLNSKKSASFQVNKVILLLVLLCNEGIWFTNVNCKLQLIFPTFHFFLVFVEEPLNSILCQITCIAYSILNLKKKERKSPIIRDDDRYFENQSSMYCESRVYLKKTPDFIKDESYTEPMLEFTSKWIQTALAKSSKKGAGYKCSAASAEWQHHQEFSFIAEI